MELVGRELLVVVPEGVHAMAKQDDALADVKTPRIMSVMNLVIVVAILVWIWHFVYHPQLVPLIKIVDLELV